MYLEKEHLFIVHMLRLHDILYKKFGQDGGRLPDCGHFRFSRARRPPGMAPRAQLWTSDTQPGGARCRGHHNIYSTMRHITKYIHEAGRHIMFVWPRYCMASARNSLKFIAVNFLAHTGASKSAAKNLTSITSDKLINISPWEPIMGSRSYQTMSELAQNAPGVLVRYPKDWFVLIMTSWPKRLHRACLSLIPHGAHASPEAADTQDCLVHSLGLSKFNTAHVDGFKHIDWDATFV